MIHKEFTSSEVKKVGQFVGELEEASRAFGVRIASLDGIYLVVNGKDTCLHLDTSGDTYTVSALVSM